MRLNILLKNRKNNRRRVLQTLEVYEEIAYSFSSIRL